MSAQPKPKVTSASPSLSVEEFPQNKKVLIVDDEVNIAQGIASLLSPKSTQSLPLKSSRGFPVLATPPVPTVGGFEIHVAHNATQALQLFEQAQKDGQPFAMGFFDVLLGPPRDGIDLVKEIFQRDPDMYAVFVTAYNDRSVDAIRDLLGEEKTDRWDYINKPFTDGEILQKARNFTSLYNLQRLKEWHQEQLAEAQRLLFSNERVNTVAAVGRSVAHEFGNLLMQIVGHADLALLKKDPVRMKEALETILKASDTATNVLSRFKRLAEGHDQSIEMKLINLAKPMDEATELMGFQFKKNNIQLRKVDCQPILLEAHHHSLVQVFMNLFINSIYAMPKGGKIDLSAKKLPDQQIEIKVRDYGPGIPEDILPKVVEPLFTTKGSMGTGLGLAICKEIIEIEHRGELTIQNHPQGGVEIRIVLPPRQEDEDVKVG